MWLPAVRGGKAGTGVRIFPAGIGGRKLSFRRHQTGSTFTYAAHLALHTGRQVRAPIDIEVLERQLHEWLGEDWKELVENPSMRQAKQKKGAFSTEREFNQHIV